MGSCWSLDGSRSHPSSPSSSPQAQKNNSRRKKGWISASDAKKEDQLKKTPGRMYLNGSSSVASLFTQQGRKGTNQDAMIVWENFGSGADAIFCGVFDGHGPYGHMVAKRVRDFLPLKLSTQWENDNQNENLRRESCSTRGSMNFDDSGLVSTEDEHRTSIDIEDKDRSTEFFTSLKESFLKAFKHMDRELRFQPSIDCFCSGSTAVTLLKQGQDIVIGNVGDSRAVLGTRDENDSLTAIQLTVDLKPNLPEEADRIRNCRGRIFALQDEPGVARVWLPYSNSPGLAMARAFGDFCLKDFGLIAVPEVTYRHLTEKDEFIVLATDGVWDVLSNDEVVNIVAESPSRNSAAKTVVESAIRAWRSKYPTSKIDDCAVVCLFLDTSTSSCSANMSEAQSAAGDAIEISVSNPETIDAIAVPVSKQETETSLIDQQDINGIEQLDFNESSDHSKEGDYNPENGLASEAVSRVDTILTLPRFEAEQKEKASIEVCE